MPGLQASRALGIAAGALVSPLLYPFFFARGARFFHPSGVVHSARVVPPTGVAAGAPADLAARLVGPALVRFAGGWFSGEAGKDSLGISLRFHDQPLPSALHGKGDQDLYFVSFPSFVLRKFISGIHQTYLHDYLANTYWAVAPYEVDGFGRVSLRLTASGAGRPGVDRAERLQRAVEEGVARLLLEAAPLGSEVHLPVAEIRLGSRLSQNLETELRTVPGSSGRGLRPSGFLQGLRVVPYAACQHARRLRGR
ncbi:hypothetical protein [Vitiosangium sp. GDMCC 1.1324]|uniref:hypothetical protein n=1 Tax=Vitiosangium sp. (strain GDMCC 1.1324) TaxID=2138576 RepID=UPI000D33DC75|nr:hypothetical protein [Vitiosangium sp. GDMCC 1.1324]PTL82791.1 hypothetical protein DAT35_18675 [Vitiosangium sp. GDMCC 1.1324]